jgi:Na+/proline symporter
VLLLLFAFVACQLALGFWAARRIASADDFLVAGRRLGPVLATASIFATWFGAESCIGAAGNAYAEGVSIATTEPFAYGLCLVLCGLFFAARFHRERITTLADFFAGRFGRPTERLAALLLLPSSLLWAAAQVRAFGHIVASNSDGALSAEAATAIAAGVAILYTTSGGLLADVITDVLQGALLLLGLAILAAAVLLHPAPPQALLPVPELAGESLAPNWLDVLEAWAIPLCGSVVAQEVLSRCLAARTPRIARNAAVLGGAIYLIAGCVPLAIGVAGPTLAPGLEDPEALLPHLSSTLLPGALNAIFAGALIAAILSTVDSCLLVVASVVTRNLLPALPSAGPPTTQPEASLAAARIAAGAAGLLAYLLATTDWNVKQLVEQASGFGSAGIFVLAVFGTFTPLGGSRAAVLSLLAGLSTWVLGSYVVPERIAHPYLASLAAAALAFSVGCALDRRAVPPRTRTGNGHP